MRQFTDQSTAARAEKARRFLKAMSDGHNGRYFHNDGWPIQADILQDAAATLEVYEALNTEQGEWRPELERLRGIIAEQEGYAGIAHDFERIKLELAATIRSRDGWREEVEKWKDVYSRDSQQYHAALAKVKAERDEARGQFADALRTIELSVEMKGHVERLHRALDVLTEERDRLRAALNDDALAAGFASKWAGISNGWSENAIDEYRAALRDAAKGGGA